MRRSKLLVVLSVMSWASAAAAQDFWIRKDYRQWSESECRRLLQDSPWTRRFSLARVSHDPPSDDADDRAPEPAPRLEYVVSFRSARPVRQAMVRHSQIRARYDRLPPEERKTFDEQAETFLGADYSDVIVLHVRYNSNVPAFERGMHNHWRKQSTESLKHSVFLIGPRSERIELLEFRQGEEDAKEFLLVFPRQREGQPVARPGDRNVGLEFQHPDIGGQGSARVFLEFRADKMLVSGTLEM